MFYQQYKQYSGNGNSFANSLQTVVLNTQYKLSSYSIKVN